MQTINYEWLTNQSNYEVRSYSNIGDREEQQDCACIVSGENELFAAVCDGMGGLNNGRMASRTVIKWLQEQYLEKASDEEFPAFFERMLDETDAKVYFLKDEYQRKVDAGSTLVTAGIRDSFLYWLSVGDSRLYIKRGQEFVQVTRDHNYLMELNEWLSAGRITQEQYHKEKKKGEALISYIGMGGVEVFDLGKKPLVLYEGDTILLTTDGLWKALTEREIFCVLNEDKDLDWKVSQLADKAHKQQNNLDNVTFVIIYIKYSE